jgi:DnaK suppressor protein
MRSLSAPLRRRRRTSQGRCGGGTSLRLACLTHLRKVNARPARDQDNQSMSRLESADLHALRLRLTERARALRQELHQDRSKLAADVRDVHVVLDRKDQADLLIQAGLDDSEFTRDLTELAQIEAALRRLDADRFGLCEDCTEPIAAQRLNVQPWASRCMTCQTRFEKNSPRSAA